MKLMPLNILLHRRLLKKDKTVLLANFYIFAISKFSLIDNKLRF